jgi:SAM-dependent methyltransferase
MPGLTRKQDAYGAAMLAAMTDAQAACVIERDDGFVDVDHTASYLRDSGEWSDQERQAISLARGRVLDIGCGAGRVALHLQAQGLKVTGIDNSPSAVEVCKARGLKDARVVPIAQASRAALGSFDTIVMCGNNFGLFGSFAGARRMLRRFHGMTSLAGRIIAETNDVYQTDRPEHLAYHRRNRRRGRMAGQIRFRIRYEGRCSPYLGYLMVSKEEMRKIVAGTGWRIARFIDSATSTYIAVLEKEPQP